MKVISFYESENQEHWLEEIGKCDWGGGEFLYELLSNGTFHETVGESSKVLLLTDGDELISFCTYAEKDDILSTGLSPWMGFVYTFPEHRGHRCLKYLFDEIERLAKEENVSEVYISTDHILLWVLEDNVRARRFYEKNGFVCTGEYITDNIGGKELREVMYLYNVK